MINYTAITDHVITVDSEADLQELLNGIDLTGITWDVISKGGYFSLVGKEGGPVVPPEIAAVLARYSALTQQETDAITKYVTAELNANNWNLRDEVFCFALNTTDFLIGMKSLTALNVNAAVRGDAGVSFNGTNQYINTQIINNALSQYKLNNARIGFYPSVILKWAANLQWWGMSGSSGNPLIEARDLTAVGYFSPINATNGRVALYSRSPSAMASRRENSAGTVTLQNGVQVGADPRVSTLLNNQPLYIGARNNSGNADRWNAFTAALFSVGAANGFSEVAAANNDLQLLIDLGVFSKPVLARFTGLTDLEKDAITRLVNAEALVGNWQRIDEFFSFGLSGANSLIGFKTKTAVAVNAPDFDVKGVETDGVDQAVNTNFSPLTDGINYSQNDVGISLYIFNAFTGFARHVAIGQQAGNFTGIYETGTGNTEAALNSSGSAIDAGELLEDDTLYYAERTSATVTAMFKNGQPLPAAPARRSQAIAAANIFVGASGTSAHLGGLFATAMIGGVLPNQAAHSRNIYNYLVDIGAVAQLVLDRMPTLTAPQQAAVTAYINAEAAVGNWQVTDDVICFGLGAVNGLIRWRSNTFFNNGATIDVNGATFNGTDAFVNTNFTPANDGDNYSLNNAQAEVFMKTNSSVLGRCVMGLDTNGSLYKLVLFPMNDYACNSGLQTPFVSNDDGALYSIKRENASNQQLMKDGVVISDQLAPSAAIPNSTIYLGARDLAGVADSFAACTISMWTIGGVFPDQAAHNTNLRTLLTAIGTIP